MYSSVNNHDKSKSILSLSELIGIIAVFSFVLYLLFPKGNIENFLESQGDNTHLSINYIESMLLYHPDNIELKMILMQKYTLIGKENKALKINEALISNTKEKKLLTELYKVEYLLKKSLYFREQNPKELKELKKKLLAYYEHTKGERDYLFFFGESTNIDYSSLKYRSLKNFMKENPTVVNYELEKMAYDLANQLYYKDEAYVNLQKLVKYPQISHELTAYLIYSLFEHKEFTKARKITTKLFLKSKTEDDLTKYFHLSLYSLGQDKSRTNMDISQLIQDYANLKTLLAPDITIILNTLLELGESKEASTFAINMFYTDPEAFDETGVDLAVKSLLYNAELEEARALSFFAEGKFKKQKYLDKTILISSWLSEDKAVSALNKEGYYKYKSPVYEKYFLENGNFNSDYEVLGLIYKKKVQHKQYKHIDNVAAYYEYTGEINKAENYFHKLYRQSKHKKAAYYAIKFSYKNSHFEKGLKLYRKYESKYAKNTELQELSIKKLLALKRFKEAYAMTKKLNTETLAKKKQQFTDLAWIEKDYAFLHKKLWEFEKKKVLNRYDFEKLIFLEIALNNSKKLNYLYQQAWEKTQENHYFNSLMYKVLQEKEFKKFDNIISSLSQNEKNILNKNIEFQILLADHYVQNSNIDLAIKSYNKVLTLNPNRVLSHESYLWFLLDNQEKFPKLLQKIAKHLKYLQKHPTLRQKVGISSIVAAMRSKKYKLANYWLKQLIKNVPSNKEYKRLAKDIHTIKTTKLYSQYNKMLNEEFLPSQINLKTKHLGESLEVKETSFSYEWKLYQNLKSQIMLKHYIYNPANGKQSKQTLFDISLKNSKDKFLWDIHIGTVKAKKNFLSTLVNISYDVSHVQVKLSAKYQKKTELTPRLEQNALENALELNIQSHISRRTSFAFLLQERRFQTFDKLDIGTAKKMQVSANHILRSGYPNINFNSYFSHNTFSKNIAEDFSELGISSSIGTNRKNTLNSSWKPFGSVTLAINNEQHFGGSLSLGISKVLKGDDSLDLLFNYYNGIGVISEPIYGLNVKYRF